MPLRMKLALWLTSLTVALPVAAALPGESIVLDPVTGDYTVTYFDYPDSPDKAQLRRAVFVPATKIDPAIESSFRHRHDGVIDYSYRLSNGIKGKQALISFILDPVSDIVSPVPLPKKENSGHPGNIEDIQTAGSNALSTPRDWIGRSTTSRVGGLRIGWTFGNLNSVNDGLQIGMTQAGFGLFSKDLPGIVLAQFRGHAPVTMFPAEGPQGELANELASIRQINFVVRPAAVPSIAVPLPFDAAMLLGRIQTHVQTWGGMDLLDTSFAAQLDRYLAAAAEAYRYQQPKAAKEHIETLRRMLKREHQDLERDEEHEPDSRRRRNDGGKSVLIDRLAARVLDFDLRYVLRRLGDKH